MTIAIDCLAYLVTGLTAVSFLITLANLKFLAPLVPLITPDRSINSDILVSVLIPARNEVGRIDLCLKSLVSQQHERMEILVLDDQSTDQTAEIIASCASVDARITLVNGADAPNGWVGKHWACDQLFRRSRGDLILFIDADTVLEPQAISAAIHRGISNRIDLLTVMPKRHAGCLIERLISPFIDWALFCWLPLYVAHKLKNPYLSVTFGQFMLFQRNAYQAIGGHSSIRNNPIDDLELGRRLKAHGFKWALSQGTRSVETLSYSGNLDTIRGISRSVFPSLNYSVSGLFIASTILLSLSFVPISLLLIAALTDNAYPKLVFASGTSMTLLSATWIIVCYKFEHGFWKVPLYPVSIALMVVISYRSAVTYALSTNKWKDRHIDGPRLRP
jgi:chlorobactene glucosyltransferase